MLNLDVYYQVSIVGDGAVKNNFMFYLDVERLLLSLGDIQTGLLLLFL